MDMDVVGGAIILLLQLAVFGGIWRRNNQVADYRMKVLNHLKFNTDLDYDVLHKVSYDDMMIQFWRAPESFFPEEYRPYIPKNKYQFFIHYLGKAIRQPRNIFTLIRHPSFLVWIWRQAKDEEYWQGTEYWHRY